MPDRLIKGYGGVLTAYFEAPDGTPTDPTSPTLTITADDGTSVQTSTAATVAGDGTGRVTFTVTPALASRLDYWTVAWSGTVSSVARTITTYADVCGGHLFDIQALKADLKANYTQAQLTAVRVVAEDEFERACGVAFVPRFRREALNGSGKSTLLLSHVRARTIRSATVGGTAVSDTMTAQRDGSVYLANTLWAAGSSNVSVSYEHGWDSPPSRVSKAVRLLAKSLLIDGPFDERATTMTTDLGTFSLQTPGLRGSYFGIPEVDATVDEYRVRFGVA